MTHGARDSVRVQKASLDDPAIRERLSQFIGHSPQSSPFASPAFLAVVRDVLGIPADVWIATRDDEWLAAQAVFFRAGPFGRPAGVPVPLAPYTSIAYTPAVSGSMSRQLETAAPMAHAIANEYRDVRHQFLPSVLDVRPWQWAGWIATPSYTYVVDLTRELTPTRAVRKHVRKSVEAGAVVSFDWDLERAWSAIDSTIRRQGAGIGVWRETFFAYANGLHAAGLCWMATGLSPRGDVASVRLQLGIPGTPNAYDWVAGSNTELLASGASAWLVTRVVEEWSARRFAQWDMCGAQYQSIARFKSEFGGTLAHGFSLSVPPSLGSRAIAAGRVPISALARVLRRRGLSR